MLKKTLLVLDPIGHTYGFFSSYHRIFFPYRLVRLTTKDELFSAIQKYPVRLILIDFLSAKQKKFDVFGVLKKTIVTKNIPIMFVSSQRVLSNELTYILKEGGYGCLYTFSDIRYIKAFIQFVIDLYEKFLITKEESIKDELTGLFNRRMLNLRLEQLFSLLQRNPSNPSNPSQLSCMLMDVDNFKAINIFYGHMIGDFVLREVANIILKELRNEDLAVRYGGDEFVIIVEESPEKVYLIGERLRKCIASKVFCDQSLPKSSFMDRHACIKLTVSIGLSYYQKGLVDTNNKLISMADDGLHYAKLHNKNCVVVMPMLSSF